MMASLQSLVSWKVFQNVRNIELILKNGEKTTIEKEIQRLLDFTIIANENLLKNKDNSLSSNKSAFYDKTKSNWTGYVKEMMMSAKEAEKFSNLKIAAPSEMADTLEKQGHIIFKVEASDSHSPKIIVRFFDPTEIGTYSPVIRGITQIQFPEGLDTYFDQVQQELRKLRSEKKMLDNRKTSLIGSAASSPNQFQELKGIPGQIRYSPASERISKDAEALLQDSQKFLKKVKILEYKIDLALKLETFQDYSFQGIEPGLYIYVNPKMNFSSDFSIKEFVESLQFSAGKFSSLEKYKAKNRTGYNKRYFTYEKMPLRERKNIINKAGQFMSKMFNTKCMLRSPLECKKNFTSLLSSLRYCKFEAITSCIESAKDNPAISVILRNFYSYRRKQENISKTGEHLKIILTNNSNLEEGILTEQNTFIENPLYRENVVWFLVLVELLQRQFSLDRNIGFRSNREAKLYLEKMLIDAAYNISNISQNIGNFMLPMQSYVVLQRLMHMGPEKIQEHRKRILSEIEVSQKTRLLNLSTEISKMSIDAKNLTSQSYFLEDIGPTIAGVSSSNANIIAESNTRDTEFNVQNTAGSEGKVKERHDLGLESAMTGEEKGFLQEEKTSPPYPDNKNKLKNQKKRKRISKQSKKTEEENKLFP
jgi:hypothetical protein